MPGLVGSPHMVPWSYKHSLALTMTPTVPPANIVSALPLYYRTVYIFVQHLVLIIDTVALKSYQLNIIWSCSASGTILHR
jgi:hypothetical protein